MNHYAGSYIATADFITIVEEALFRHDVSCEVAMEFFHGCVPHVTEWFAQKAGCPLPKTSTDTPNQSSILPNSPQNCLFPLGFKNEYRSHPNFFPLFRGVKQTVICNDLAYKQLKEELTKSICTNVLIHL